MIKFLLRTAVIAIAGLTFLVSSLSAFKPETLYRSQVAVLMYHHIHDTDQSGATITTELFRSQLSYLKGRGYHFISLQEFKDFMNGAAVPDNAVLVTFDDGYEGFYQNAYPVLTKLNIPAVNFIITGTLDHPLDGNIPFLNRDEIRTMTSHSPGIEVQCHTDSLHGKTEGDQGKALLVARLPKDGRTETEDEYKKRIVDDTRACTGRLKDLTPHQVDAMAYPYGIYNPLAASLVKEGGIQYAFTILPRMATQGMDPLRIPRINAGSPYITPLALHNMIMRRVTAPRPAKSMVGLRDTLEQVGGELTKDKADGSTVIHYNGIQWKVRPGSQEAFSGERVLTLDKPVTIVGSRSYILLEDLEKLLGIDISSDPHTRLYTARLPDASDSDAEGRKGQR